MRCTFHSLEDPETLRQLVHRLREGIYITNAAGEILDANPAFLEMFGVASLDELRGSRAEELLVEPEARARELELLAREGAVREFEFQIRRPDGEIRTVLDTCFVVPDEASGEVLLHGILVDITARKELERQLREATIRDPLTGCFNRRYLDEVAKRWAEEGTGWGVIIVDIDHFKRYNDRWGHQAGDEMLVKLSRFLMSQVRAEDAVIRLGGDEFLVLLPDEHAASTAQIAGRFRATAERSAPVPFSLGWAVRENAEPLERTVDRADQELIQVRVDERQYDRPRKSPRSPG